MTTFTDAMAKELAKARQKHKPINSMHEGYAVILEELDEFWQEVMKKRENRDHLQALSELIQVAAMCQRVAEDVVLPQIPCGSQPPQS